MTRIDFIDDFLEHRTALPFVKALNNSYTGINEEFELLPHGHFREDRYLLYDLPGYFKVKPSENQRLILSNSFKGSYIRLSRYKNFEDYYQKKVSSKRRSTLNNHEKRLRHCLDIRHEVYFGSIPKETYQNLFGAFKKLLERRFYQKGAVNSDLQNWDRYRDSFYPLILSKRACISVIFHEDRPISFSINLVYSNTLYGYTKSYDTDYSKFSLGFIEFNLLLKWAFDQGIQLFDLLKGQYEYKIKLADGEYYFQRAILYTGNKSRSSLGAYLATGKTRGLYATVRVLKLFGVHLLVNSFLRYKEKREVERNQQPTETTYEIRDEKPGSIGPEQIPVASLHTHNRHLKKPVMDFLFSHKERLAEIVIYPSAEAENEFIIRGEKATARIIIK